MSNQAFNPTLSNDAQQLTQRLIATSTGFIDAFIITVHDDVPMLLPQSIVLSALTVPGDAQEVEWYQQTLPVYSVVQPDIAQATALVIEGERTDRRFALLTQAMPETLRLRISTVRDDNRPAQASVYQYVTVEGIAYQIPHLEYIEKILFDHES